MNEKQLKSVSKLLSLILRHEPAKIGLTLDAQGWADTQTLLEQMEQYGHPVSMAVLEEVVTTNDKQRFAFNEDKTRIRASQGHSVPVELGLDPQVPPEYLYHGTVAKFLEAIRGEGLRKMSRQHVHLSADKATAEKVGSRRGAAVILGIRSGEMYRKGRLFYCSENGVWLTDEVPATFIDF